MPFPSTIALLGMLEEWMTSMVLGCCYLLSFSVEYFWWCLVSKLLFFIFLMQHCCSARLSCLSAVTDSKRLHCLFHRFPINNLFLLTEFRVHMRYITGFHLHFSSVLFVMLSIFLGSYCSWSYDSAVIESAGDLISRLQIQLPFFFFFYRARISKVCEAVKVLWQILLAPWNSQYSQAA